MVHHSYLRHEIGRIECAGQLFGLYKYTMRQNQVHHDPTIRLDELTRQRREYTRSSDETDQTRREEKSTSLI